MRLHVGEYVWITCEVKPGPFSDERRVRCASAYGDWLGFVPASVLQEPILEGQTRVRAVIIGVENGKFSAKIPGEGIGPTVYEDLVSKAQAFDTVPT